MEAATKARCRYTNRICYNPRATKQDGSLHALCDEHRRKANESQKKLRDGRKERYDQLVREAQARHAAMRAAGQFSLSIEFDPLDAMTDGTLSATEWQEIAEMLQDQEDE